MLWVISSAAVGAAASDPPDSTWVQLQGLPAQGRAPIFAVAVDPANNQVVIAANSQGSVVRSANGGRSWSTVHPGRTAIDAISFSPFSNGLVLAGTRGDGALVSHDAGSTWSVAAGLGGRSVRVFGFALTAIAAGTDHGVFTSEDGTSWTPSGLTTPGIRALAVEAIHAPVRLLAGSDVEAAGGALTFFQSVDGGATWKRLTPALTGTMTLRLVSGPLPPTGNVRPLLAATNSGLFASADNGATFNPLSGGGLLPTTDYTDVAFVTSHFDRFYVASDGGGSGSGGLWRTSDGGQTFPTLRPPQASVTALAVSNDEQPTLYVAMFQPSTHAATLWAFHDTGGIPVGPTSGSSTVASAARKGNDSEASAFGRLLASPELPYVALGFGAVVVILVAVVNHFRGRYR